MDCGHVAKSYFSSLINHEMSLMTHKYSGIAYRQTADLTTPWLVTFVATAEDISSWAGIPRRSEKGLIGFQRPDDERRVTQAEGFFKNTKNQSPTALIVGIHRPAEGERPRVRLEFTDSDASAQIRACELHIDFDQSTYPLSHAVRDLKTQIGTRLADAREEPAADDNGDGDEEETAEDADESTDEAADDSPELELGKSLLMELEAKLDDATWCAANESAIIDLAKPCTVIDGQHRLKGAERRESHIPFSVIALFNCSWPEQVFQFTVVNYTAKGIPDQFITANAALSLTGKDLDVLKGRLQQAGVKVLEYDLMSVVNFDRESPFFERVSMAASGTQPGKLGYKTMVQIAKAWHSTKTPAVGKLIEASYPEITAGGARQRRKAKNAMWHDNTDWGGFFKHFWAVVRDHYQAEAQRVGVADPWDISSGTHLTVTAVLRAFQERFLVHLAGQDEWFELPSSLTTNAAATDHFTTKVGRLAKKVCEKIPLDFFTATWAWSSVNIGPGKEALKTCLQGFIESGNEYKYRNSTLFRG